MPNKLTAFREHLRQPGLVVAPGVFDMVSLRLADSFGFDALYMTGYGTVASHMGLPDAGLATYTDMVGRVNAMATMARTPLIADGDTGYGGLLNMRHTVRGYEAAGAVAIQLEDQEFPKKCGHTPGRRVIPMQDMVRKIRVAVESRTSPDFLIIARTDARAVHGLEDAIARAQAFVEAGADATFVEAPVSVDEMARIGREIKVPQIANIVFGGKTPDPGREALASMGFAGVLYANAALQAALRASYEVLSALKRDGSLANVADRLATFQERQAAVAKPRWDALEARYKV